LLEKAKELTKVSAELTEIIAKIEKERQIEQPQNFWEAIQKFRQENNLEAAGIEAEEVTRRLKPRLHKQSPPTRTEE
jgi:PIN domain nuclease of toxin-antitoxin system